MTTELKKLALFAIIIGAFTSTYVTFLGTGLNQGFFTDGFWINWFKLIPKAYIIVLPFLLIVGPFVRKIVDRVFNGVFNDSKRKMIESGNK
jgi:hypothetical protein